MNLKEFFKKFFGPMRDLEEGYEEFSNKNEQMQQAAITPASAKADEFYDRFGDPSCAPEGGHVEENQLKKRRNKKTDITVGFSLEIRGYPELVEGLLNC